MKLKITPLEVDAFINKEMPTALSKSWNGNNGRSREYFLKRDKAPGWLSDGVAYFAITSLQENNAKGFLRVEVFVDPTPQTNMVSYTRSFLVRSLKEMASTINRTIHSINSVISPDYLPTFNFKLRNR